MYYFWEDFGPVLLIFIIVAALMGIVISECVDNDRRFHQACDKVHGVVRTVDENSNFGCFVNGQLVHLEY